MLMCQSKLLVGCFWLFMAFEAPSEEWWLLSGNVPASVKPHTCQKLTINGFQGWWWRTVSSSKYREVVWWVRWWWGGDKYSVTHKVMTQSSLRVDLFFFFFPFSNFKPSVLRRNLAATGPFVARSFWSRRSTRQSLRFNPAGCQVGIGFESRYQRAAWSSWMSPFDGHTLSVASG